MSRAQKTKPDRLTLKQLRYVRELGEIFAVLDLDFEGIRDYPEAEERTAHLERILSHVVRGEVITQFTLLDELLTHKLARRMLGSRHTNIRRSKRFQALKKALVDSRLPVSRKLEMLRQFTRVPLTVTAHIVETARIRNVFAHSFFLDVPPTKLAYKGKNILSADGVKRLQADYRRTLDFLIGW